MRQALFALQFLLLDLLLRGPAIYQKRPLMLLGALGAAALWGAASALARAWPLRLLLALLASCTAAVATIFFLRFRVLFDEQALRSILRYWRDGLPVVRPWLAHASLGLLALAALQWLLLARPRLRPRAAAALLAPAAAALWLGGASSLDARALSSLVALRSAAAAAPPPEVIDLPLAPVPRRPPSVILIVSESLRADRYCSSPASFCPTAPRINALLPDRIGFSQMRSVASFTVISVAAISTGHHQAIPRGDLLRLPTFFEMARAARGPDGERITTAYWTSHCDPIFERPSILDATDHHVFLQDLTGGDVWQEDVDDRLLAHFSAHLADLPRPFFLVLQLSGTHTPYAVDEHDAPFQPWTRSVSWSTLGELGNAYKNSIHRQDARLAGALAPLVRSPDFADTVLLFTSDHGEEFGEHKQIHHGQDVLDPQIHVPFWIAGALSGEQRAALAANQDRFVTHLDLLPTLLDLWGLHGSFHLGPQTRSLPGRSLLRPVPAASAPVPLANCTESSPCPFQNAGLLLDDTKIEAQAWDPGWNCWRLGEAERPLPHADPACERLRDASRRWFPRLPNGEPNEAR